MLAYAKLNGWRWWADTAVNAPRVCWSCKAPSRVRRNEAGHPDLLLIRRPRVIWVELKREDGVVDPDQQAFLDVLRECGQQVYVWRPSDFAEVMEILR